MARRATALLCAGLMLGSGLAQAQQALSLEEVARAALINSTDTRLQEYEVRAAENRLRQARGQFDPRLELEGRGARNEDPLRAPDRASFAASGIDVERSTSDNYRLDLRSSKQLRSGLEVGGTLGFERLDDMQSRYNPNVDEANYGVLGFSVTVPLMRGLGAEETAAGERSAALELEASRLDYAHQAGTGVVQALNAYWEYRAAELGLALARAAEERAREQQRQTERLVEADQVPAAELNLVGANLADKIAQTSSAEQSLTQARTRLGLAMGLDHVGIRKLGLALSEFPPLRERLLRASTVPEPLISAGLNQRLDLQAARQRERAASVALRAARLGTRAELDFELGAQYRGLLESDEGQDFFATSHDYSGTTVTATLTYRWALGNNVQQGRLGEQMARHQQSLLRLENLSEQIGAGIADSAQTLRQSAEQVRRAAEAVSLYEQAVEDERTRYRMGSSTLLEVLQMEDRLYQARVREVQQRSAYAAALTALLQQTGELVRRRPGQAEGFELQLEPLAETDTP